MGLSQKSTFLLLQAASCFAFNGCSFVLRLQSVRFSCPPAQYFNKQKALSYHSLMRVHHLTVAFIPPAFMKKDNDNSLLRFFSFWN